MTFTVVLHVYRRSDLSPAEFKKHYEETHIPLMKSIGGEAFPLSHTRQYISHTNLVSEAQSDVGYDAISRMVFEDQSTFETFRGLLQSPENVSRVTEDCSQFLDLSKAPQIVVIEDVCDTRRI
ncbi:hypothetical protein ASPVEDRAFT_28410 [Aspergillus versicolor CBS 583.65]|uniref:EthD domain-containing protein n=1 Tax=Aspergillus versicolor CBS 583.65 TaxID=1036611 RepID=A0A1L9PJZ9_ASPVE|nr:uncharacterized protein ASPVEDRAFT_28410 [Aspergillus versicolor CBS 583.65]OJJ01765.1 hypothetical protein ASPVEDRAFT_28410 [Aspergillus versicolor CBS 583.65]